MEEHHSKKCIKARHVCCDYSNGGTAHTFKTTFYFKQYLNCKYSDLAYVVICSTCNEEYIGWTEKRNQGFKVG